MTTKCSLCGFESEQGQVAGAQCPFNRTCKLIRCPNCGYSMLRGESSIIRLFKRLSLRKKSRWEE
jgi:transposase